MEVLVKKYKLWVMVVGGKGNSWEIFWSMAKNKGGVEDYMVLCFQQG